ncbi:MAG: nucleotidyltransferase domain-containing protein, partial [Candidatus Poribacteria bacterium]
KFFPLFSVPPCLYGFSKFYNAIFSERVMQMKIGSETTIESELDDICNSLLNVDPDIQEIILFGSFVYAPSLARDIDLLVTTSKRKPYEIYSDAIADFSKNVDLIIKEIGESIGDHIAWGIKSTGHILNIAYSYMGNYPKETAKEEYKNWRKIVEDFLNDLEQDLRLVR